VPEKGHSANTEKNQVTMRKAFVYFAIFSMHSCSTKKNVEQIKTYYDNGKLRSTSEISNNKKNGEEKLFFDNGNLFMRQYFKDDMPVDSLFQYDKDSSGLILFKGHFTNVARLKVYYGDGGLLFGETDFKEKAVEDGLVSVYFTNSKTASTSVYKNGKRNGIQVMYYLNGNIRKISHYTDGLKVPPEIEFDSSGNILRNTPMSAN
jgi:uncharacterized protein